MKVIFYTATCFMDTSLEVINVLKKIVDLHVIIEITEKSKNQNIISVDSLPEDVVFGSPQRLLSPSNYCYMKPYIDGAASVNFLVYKKTSIGSLAERMKELYKYIREIKPDILHVEGVLIRSSMFIPSLFRFKKIFIGIHDPIPHKGEKEIKLNFLRKIFLNHSKTKGIFFYSSFAKKQFENYYKTNTALKWVITMGELTYFSNLAQNETTPKKGILFFGRISPYKGIEVLLDAMPEVFRCYPNEQLTIAGRSINGYRIPLDSNSKNRGQITILNKHISNEELVKQISEAKFVVCPYIEATQSGVLMTSFALKTPVIASSVGAFTEYIDERETGSLVPVNDSEALSSEIKKFLKDDHYKNFFKDALSPVESWKKNEEVFLNAYSQ